MNSGTLQSFNLVLILLFEVHGVSYVVSARGGFSNSNLVKIKEHLVLFQCGSSSTGMCVLAQPKEKGMCLCL